MCGERKQPPLQAARRLPAQHCTGPLVLHRPDTTLREVLDLVKEASPDQRSPAAAFAMGLVYPNRTGKMVVKPLAELHSVDRGAADTISLQQLGWRPADALSVAQLEAARHRA